MIRSFILILSCVFITGSAFAAPAPTLPGLVAVNITNSGTTGTTVNKLAKINSSGNALIVATTDTDNAVGVVLSGAGTTGLAQIAVSGVVSCVFDATATTGNYVQISSTVAGDCKDSGAATRPTSGQVIGKVITGGSGAGTYSLALQIGASNAGTGTVTEQKNTAGAALAISGNCDNTSTNASSPCQYSLAAPYFSAYPSVASTTVTTATSTKMAINTKVSDSNTWYDAVTNFRFTPLLAGRYNVHVQVTCNGTTVSACVGQIFKNGANYAQQQINGSAATQGANANTIITFNGTTDFVEAFVLVVCTGTCGYTGGTAPEQTLFEANYIGP